MDTNQVLNFLHSDIKSLLQKTLLSVDINDLQEIRLRLNKPIELKLNSGKFIIDNNARISKSTKNAYIISDELFSNTLNKIAKHSLYAFQDELKNGFITLQGGHRVGIIGTCVLENNYIKSVRDITSLNIRVSHDIKNIASPLKNIYDNDITNTLIISPPACGKTTLLRDLIRVFSDDFFRTVGVVDERSEICNQNYVGIRTDIINNCPKSIGMLTLLRTMSPEIICVDEIGKKDDVLSINELFNCGVTVIATVHAKNILEVQKKENIKELITSKNFDKYIVLTSPKSKPTVYDKNFKEIYYD